MSNITCHCGKSATMRCVVYKTKSESFRCFDCAHQWLLDTSRCPKCGGTLKECHPDVTFADREKKACRATKIFLDRGCSAMWEGGQ